jgi:hypothetical protein
MRRGGTRGARGAGFGGSVVIAGVATALLLIAITGARRPAQLEARGAPPWPAPVPRAAAAGIHAAGLSVSGTGFVVTRYAVHLDVLVAGQVVRVPAGVGRGAPVSTSDESGIIHVASDVQAPVFTLGQFFDEWQVALSASRLGGLSGGTVAAYVNGARFDGDPETVVLAPHLQIAVSYAPAGRDLVPGPASYVFPAGV